jgi:uncharacterized membrane protein YcgQ (UPF0703/DUF1980 family)
MAHGHDHDHDTYYLDQLCMIGLCAAFAAVCLTMYFVNTDMLKRLLAEQFHPFVLLSGIGLLVLVVVRSVALWRQAGQASPAGHTHGHDHARDHHHHHHDHDHEHAHGHDHGHEHGDCHGHEHAHEHAHHVTVTPAHAGAPAALHDHSHEHGADQSHGHDHGHGHGDDHDHAWAPWRYVVLLVPIMLYLLGLPSRGLSVKAGEIDMTREAVGWAGLVTMGPSPLQQVAALTVLTMDPLAQKIRIELDGKEVDLDRLQPGTRILIRRSTDRRFRDPVIKEVVAGTRLEQAKGASTDPLDVVGEIVSVNPGDSELVVRRNGSDKAETFDLSLGPIFNQDFKGLEALAFSPEMQKDWKGLTVRVLGQFAPNNNRQFTLARYRIQCCGADAVQVSLPMVLNRGTLDEIPSHPQHNDWVQVTGRIDFREQPGRAGKVTVLVVPRPRYIEKSQPDTDPYIR